jgi:RNA ligase (TIGR02306 family)
MEDHRAIVCEVEVFPHENADRLELARPIGTDWILVVGKDDFKTGDLMVYIPIDSIIPEELFQKHFAKSKIKLEKNRVRSAKIRGIISQGLPIKPEPHYQLGQDVTDELGIKKYEPPMPGWLKQGQQKIPKKKKKFVRYVDAQFPKYTKIRNHKNFKNAIVEGTEVVILEKIHGTNFRTGTIYVGGFKRPWYKKLWAKIRGKNQPWRFTVGSHNVVKWHEDKVYHRAAKEAGLDKLGEEWNGFIFYGEIYGHGIQELSYGVPPGEIRLAIIDILYKNEYGQANYLPWCEVQAICERLNLDTAPEIYAGPWYASMINLADGKSKLPQANHHREGMVVKPLSESWHPSIGRLILKRISDTYLLGKKRTDYH